MLLSSSEAGISLLAALPPGTTSSLAHLGLARAAGGSNPAGSAGHEVEQAGTFAGSHQAAAALASRHAEPAMAASEVMAEPGLSPAPKAAGPITAALRGMLKPKVPQPSFETLFAESAEDTELLGKLQSGYVAHVR
jgi:hypothetical protein